MPCQRSSASRACCACRNGAVRHHGPPRIRTRSKTDFSGNANLDIVGVSLGIEILPITVSDFYNRFSEWFQVIF